MTPQNDVSDEGDVSRVRWRRARAVAGLRCEFNLDPSNNERTQKERVALNNRAKRASAASKRRAVSRGAGQSHASPERRAMAVDLRPENGRQSAGMKKKILW